MREGGGNSDGKSAADVVYLFRTYNHRTRVPYFGEELNPRGLDKSTLTIVEACRATSAAPTWFPHVKLRGRRFIDGGVTDFNNPADLAWREANEMAHKPGEIDQTTTKGPCVLLSIGTGRTAQPRRFGLYHLLLAAKHKLTDTEATHKRIKGWIHGYECFYRRFNVPESYAGHQGKGLEKVELDSCKKKRRTKSELDQTNGSSPLLNAESEDIPGGYKPRKYRYSTYDKIRIRTEDYCRSTSQYDNESSQYDTVASEIRRCAMFLSELSEQRYIAKRDRWERFRQHPVSRSRTSPEPGTQASTDPESQAEL